MGHDVSQQPKSAILSRFDFIPVPDSARLRLLHTAAVSLRDRSMRDHSIPTFTASM